MRLPVGCSDFRSIIADRQQDLIDKTLLIKAVIEDDAQVILVTRPRRFGKTLNMSMLRCFFSPEVDGRTTSGLFDRFNIIQEKNICLQHQGKHPVIFLTLKNIPGDCFEHFYAGMSAIIKNVYSEHRYLLSSDKIFEEDKIFYNAILKREASMIDVLSSLQHLTRFLYLHHGASALILIDEYDAPIHAAFLHGYYEKVICFFRDFLGSGLKDNPYLFKGVLTGILRISKESLFSGLNNVSVCSVLSSQYSAYFGFTEDEMHDVLENINGMDSMEQIKKWYNGYQIGGTILYNPWSIVNYIQHRIFKPYWVNTSDNAMIKDILSKSDVECREQLQLLFQNTTIEQIIDEHFVYADLDRNTGTAVWSFLLMTGYLKVVSVEPFETKMKCTLAIPNAEIHSLYNGIVEEWLSNGRDTLWYARFIDHLLRGDIEAFSQNLQSIMEETVGIHDVAIKPEAFYHGFILGLTATLHHHPLYEIRSNRESGYGRYDYLIFSKDLAKMSVILEFKRVNTPKPSVLNAAAKSALNQIVNQDYFSEIKQRGGTHILAVGLAFCGKKFSIAHRLTVVHQG